MADLLDRLFSLLTKENLTLTTAESCTGGMISAIITDKPGSSKIFERGFVTYSNAAKIELLGVDSDTLNTHGAVSSQTASEMAFGALANSHADIAVSVTGIAGPESDATEKPVGLVYIATLRRGDAEANISENHFTGARADIRGQSAQTALQQIIEMIETT